MARGRRATPIMRHPQVPEPSEVQYRAGLQVSEMQRRIWVVSLVYLARLAPRERLPVRTIAVAEIPMASRVRSNHGRSRRTPGILAISASGTATSESESAGEDSAC